MRAGMADGCIVRPCPNRLGRRPAGIGGILPQEGQTMTLNERFAFSVVLVLGALAWLVVELVQSGVTP